MAGIVLPFAVTVVAGTALAGSIQTIDGYTYSGVVEQVTDTGVMFLWEKDKEQPDEILKGASDKAYAAQGSKAEVRDIPFGSIAKIDGVQVERFPALFRYNLFFRTMQELEAGRIRVTTSGEFYRQVKSAAVLLVALLVLVPLMLMLVSILLPGNRMSFFGGVGFAMAFTLAGLGASFGSASITAAIPAMASAGAQGGLTVAIALLLALTTHFASRYSFLQGLVFTLVWGGALALGIRLAARFAGVGSLGL